MMESGASKEAIFGLVGLAALITGSGGTGYTDTFFFLSKHLKYEYAYGGMIAGGVFGVAGVLLAVEGKPEEAMTCGAAGGCLFVMGLSLLPSDSKRRKTTFLVGPTGVGVVHSF